MTLTLSLLGLSLYILVWEKLPDWGTWFNALIERLPGPLAYLYDAWRCPFCFGFWAALALHGLTGLPTVPALFVQLDAGVGLALAWFLDALATATLIMVGKLLLSALAGPAIRGHRLTQSFRAGEPESESG